MEIFIDTANIEEIKEAISWGVIDGCTTNPKIVSKENVPFEARMKEILAIVDGPVSIEVTTNDTNEMVVEAETYNKWAPNVVIKIPMTIEGLKAVNILSRKGIKTNVTAAMSMKQAVLAAKSGATYVSLFWGRIEDMGYDAEKVVGDTVQVFEKYKFKCKIIIGSLRQVSHISRAIRTGVHVLTIPPAVLKQIPTNPRTESTIVEFLLFWEEYKKRQNKYLFKKIKKDREVKTDKHCYCCGTEKELTYYKNLVLKTKGFPVRCPDGYVCKDCINAGRVLGSE